MNLLSPDMDAAWRAGLWHRADQAPVHPRLPLYAGPSEIGSVATSLMEQLEFSGVRPEELGLSFKDDPTGARWCLDGVPTLAMERLADALKTTGLIRTWYGELLPMMDRAGRPVGAVERGVTRLLGIPVHCVHLVGVVDGVGTWVQQRSMNKAEAPGLWDTLMGGTVASGESPEVALQRELWEEAGLQTHQLRSLAFRGRLRVARPASPDDALAYSVDLIDCFVASLAPDVQPVNLDGEVVRFDLLSAQTLTDRLVGEHFTLEAACVLLHVQGFTRS